MSDEENIYWRYGFLVGVMKSIDSYLKSEVMTDAQKLDSIRGHMEFAYNMGAVKKK